MVDKKMIRGDDIIKVSVDITNTGKTEGKEVVQLYIQDVNPSIERPLKELKRFTKVNLNSGQMKKIVFELYKDDLSFYDPVENSWAVEKGMFKILIGSSSRDIRLEGDFEYLE